MSQLKDDLNKVADLLEPEGAWCQGVYARDIYGSPVLQPDNAAAYSRCLDGAMLAVSGCLAFTVRLNSRYRAMQDALRVALNSRNYVEWQDSSTRTQAEVVALLRDCAERAS